MKYGCTMNVALPCYEHHLQRPLLEALAGACCGCCIQVAYPGDAVVVPIKIQNPLLRAPASVRYTIASTTGEDPSEYIPQDALEGVLSWDQDLGSSLNLTIPVNWTSVPPEAEYRLAVTLEALWRAVVDSPASGAVAMHLFGVQPDQCPPGSYRCLSADAIGSHLLQEKLLRWQCVLSQLWQMGPLSTACASPHDPA